MLGRFKKFLKPLFYRPKVGKLGRESLVLLPRKLVNRHKIEIGDRAIVYGHSIIFPLSNYGGLELQGKIIIGDDVYIGKFCQLIAMNTLTIGNGTVLSEYVYVNDSSHGFDPTMGLIMKQPLSSKGSVTIGENCFLGFGVIVMPGVSLGDWCIVGAGSVVTKSFPSHSMIAGSPARLLKTYSESHGDWIHSSSDNLIRNTR